MRFIPLTQGDFALVDNADFDELSKFKWYSHKGRAVRKPRTIEGRRTGFVWMHREIMKPSDDEVVDHINGYKLDNTRENLRVCTHSQNEWNKKAYKTSTTGAKNIHWNKRKKRFGVTFQKHGKKIICGYYKTLEQAVFVRNKVVLEVHEGFNPVIRLSTSG